MMRASNLAAIVAMASWLAYRAAVVGVIEALAEASGLAQYPGYIDWRDVYVPVHKDLFAATFDLDAVLDSALVQALEQGNNTRLRELATDHGHGVFTIPLLDRAFCARLAQEVSHFAQSDHPSAPPNTMHDHGVTIGVDGLNGLDGLTSLVRDRVLTPLATALFERTNERDWYGHGILPASSPLHFADHHAFVVRYNASEKAGLDNHHDASDVTLNICLEDRSHMRSDEPTPTPSSEVSSTAGSGSLQFCGFVGDAQHRKRTIALAHAVGRAVVHLGTHRHGVTNLREGHRRQNFIMWARQRQRAFFASEMHPRHPMEEPPDVECLSWTHDADYTEFAPLPEVAVQARAKRKEMNELIALASRATDEHIAKLPSAHRPFVHMLRAMARQNAENNATTQAQPHGDGSGSELLNAD